MVRNLEKLAQCPYSYSGRHLQSFLCTGVPAADGVQSEEEDEEDSATYSSGNKDKSDKSQTSVSSTPDKKENMKKLLDIKP